MRAWRSRIGHEEAWRRVEDVAGHIDRPQKAGGAQATADGVGE